jgi:ATP phosphoribosyltransferase
MTTDTTAVLRIAAATWRQAQADLGQARDQLAARVQGVVFGQQYLMLDYDCPRAVLERATAITPGLESPTIAPLADPEWVAVRALVPRRDVNAIMDELAGIGAKAILASDVRFCRF